MKQEDKLKADKLASEHWDWFQKIVGHVAMDFFVHGYKHGGDDAREEIRKEGKDGR